MAGREFCADGEVVAVPCRPPGGDTAEHRNAVTSRYTVSGAKPNGRVRQSVSQHRETRGKAGPARGGKQKQAGKAVFDGEVGDDGQGV